MIDMKLFFSCDMEGTAGIMNWNETDYDKPNDYAHWVRQMSREVAAACEGVLAGGASEILVKDAHDYGRNLDPELLPEEAKIFRGWGKTPLCMMAGLDESFDGAIFTGYHSGAGMDTNPLAHTMNTKNYYVKCNGELMPGCILPKY